MKILLRCTRPIHLLSVHHRNVSALVKPEYGSDSRKSLPFPTQENRHAWTNTNPNYVTKLHEILQKCAKEREPTQGRACHSQIIRYGLQSDTTTVNILLNMYSKCGFVGDARQLFDEMPDRSLVSWNTMIYSYTKNGDEAVALDLFVQMQREGTQLSEFTVSSVLCACASNVAVFECKQLHALAIKASVVTNVFVGTALIDVYGKCSLVKDAVRVFECMPDKSAVTWSSMVSGYVRNAHYEKALVMFRRMNAIGLELNQFIISSVLSACAAIAARIDGNQIHAVFYKFGFHANVFVASSLVDMYSKCGCIKEAYGVFSTTEEMNLVLWNAMISGFSRHACSVEAMLLFEKMQQIGLQPNEVTYVSVLSACGHVGLVKEGKRYFYTMMREHNVEPNIFHYACMVDVLGRTGLIDEAIDLIHKMPFQATASMWGSLLASCRVHGNIEVAEVAARHLFEIEPENAGNHVLLSNIYAANKKWEEVAQARKLLKESEAKKERGKSWIEIKGKVHIFMVGERNHPRIAEIYSRLEDILEKMEKLGYRGETAHDLHDVEENWKQELLRHHSEKLALVFGLMYLPSSAPVRIMKNLRICGDCHVFMKFASSITGREIIVRDTNRFHNFRNGLCSCGEFW